MKPRAEAGTDDVGGRPPRSRPDETSTEILPAGAERIAVDPAAVDLVGRTLGKFGIVERLGRGGSGDVYRAEQTPLGRSVVIKVLRREVAAAPNRVERFLREAKLASRLDHPYAAHIYAFGAEPDGVLWIAMEHVRGSTLDDLITQRGAIPPAIFGPLFGRLCEVVHSAHELGIVHRDIKGGNVMVIERAGQLLPKLLDFGIAKGDGESPILDGPDDVRVGLTGHGSTLGSPQYMSPEQWQRPSEVDARADVYALGVLAYRCISGQLPFRSHERLALIEAHLTLPPPPLPDVPAPVAAAILRALEKAPGDRWPSALAFAEAMRAAAGGTAPEIVPIFDPAVRDAWTRAGPQPIADAIANLAGATTTIDADAALRELVAITCRWLAVLALANPDVAGPLQQPAGSTFGNADPAASVPTSADGEPRRDSVRARARNVVGRDAAAPWLLLARAAAAAAPGLPGLDAALAGCDPLLALAERLDARTGAPGDPTSGAWRARSAANLATEIAAAADALRSLEPLLAYQLVVGCDGGAESWQGVRRRVRERVVVWPESDRPGGEPLADGEVGLLDGVGRVVARLSPLAQVIPPLPSAEPELFLLWRGGRGAARLVAAPWGFERDDDAAGQRLALLSTEDSSTAADPSERSPYPGLAPYGIDDADRFVGREREIESLANRLIRAPMIAVLGPSGVGKSSFIHAGLLPRLREHYQILSLRPGRHPLGALAATPAVRGHGDDPPAIAARLREIGDSAQRGAIVVVDQLEELVTLCGDPDERRRFAETLAAAGDAPSAPVRVVVTLRDDFATVIESEAAFRGRFEVFVLGTPPPEALRRIVTEPAKRAQVTVEPRVVDEMVAEVAGSPAALPLLSFTASQLWANRDRAARRIEHTAYTAIGGVAGALASYADEIYDNLAHRDQEVVRDLFARLVASDGTRIPAPRAEVEQLAGAHAVIAHLIDARLLVVRDDAGADVVEIVHECLAERWPRLARWRSEDAADRALLGDVGAAARRWQDAGRRPDLLWRGEALAELRRLAARSSALTDVERAFATEADRAERRARRIRRAATGLAMVALATIAGVMAYLSVAANDSRDDAEVAAGSARVAAKLAEDRLTLSLIAQGKRELNDGRALQALAFFGEAMRRGADSQGLRAMVSIASRGWHHERALIRGLGAVALAISPAGWVAVGDQKGHILWFGTDGKPLGELTTEVGIVFTLRRVGDQLIATGRDGIAVIDASHREILHITPQSPALGAMLGPGPDEISTVERNALRVYSRAGKLLRAAELAASEGAADPVFADDGRTLLLHNQHQLTFADTTTMRTRVVARDTFGMAAPSDDRKLYGYLDQDRAVHVIGPDGSERRKLQPTIHPYAVELSATGDRVATIAEHAITVFDGTGKVIADIQIDSVQSIAALAGDDLWSGGSDGVLRHYHRGVLVASLPSLLTEIEELRMGAGVVVALANDSSMLIADANATQLALEPEPCEGGIPMPAGITGVVTCGDREYIYYGRRLVAEGSELGGFVALDEASQRSAAAGREIFVFAPGPRQLAKTTAHLGAIAFEDANHLLVAELQRGSAVWRWAFATDTWERVIDAPNVRSIAVVAGKIALGFHTGRLAMHAGARELYHVELGDPVDFLTSSRDGRYLAVQLASGATLIVEVATGSILRRLQPADALGGAPMFDASGELLTRTSRGALGLWDRTTGDDLIVNFDLLRGHVSAVFTPDGRLEVNGRGTGLIDIPRDTRPTAAIVREIECRVPLRVTAGRLEPSQVDCRR